MNREPFPYCDALSLWVGQSVCEHPCTWCTQLPCRAAMLVVKGEDGNAAGSVEPRRKVENFFVDTGVESGVGCQLHQQNAAAWM